MKIRNLLIIAWVATFTMISCKKGNTNVEKTATTKEASIANMEMVSLNISGMTCEIGCAKTIQSKLSKKEGVASAKVIFTDSIAKVEFDANKTSKEELISFINGIAGGNMYKASETTSEK